VLSGCALFVFSFAFGRQRGVVWRTTRLWQMRREQDYHHFLRAAYELLEVRNAIPSAVGELRSTEPLALRALASNRHWSPTRTRKLASRMAASQLVTISATDEAFRLTPRGILQALNSVRDHRLLELYMMKEASAHVIDADREADYLEHGLLPEHLAELYGALSAPAVGHIPPNPHASTPTPPS
jgi:Mn-dependent DtxR family transcriptional regulator